MYTFLCVCVVCASVCIIIICMYASECVIYSALFTDSGWQSALWYCWQSGETAMHEIGRGTEMGDLKPEPDYVTKSTKQHFDITTLP